MQSRGIILVVCGAIALGVLIALLQWRGVEDVPAIKPTVALPIGGVGTDSDDPRDGDGRVKKPVGGRSQEPISVASFEPTFVEGTLLNPKEPNGFTDADVADASRPIVVNMPDARVSVGDEVEVVLRISGPALESLTLLLEFDPKLIRYIDKSAKAGEIFRHGIEFYAENDKGRMVLIHSGSPGEKNTLGVDEAELIRFRVKGISEGRVNFNCPDKSVTFVHALGGEAEYHLKIGEIVVE